MQKEYLKTILSDQRETCLGSFKDKPMVIRSGIDQCRAFLSAPNVLLISGMRRAGKSVFAHQAAGTASYSYVSFDDERLITFGSNDFQLLLEAWLELFGQTEYLVFDEIQNIEGWELFINRIRPGHKIIVTGSNANLMSSEMATNLTGRFDEWTLFPMSFQEFVRYRGLAPSAQKGVFTTLEKSAYVNAFEEYMMCGGVFERYLFGAAHLRTLFRSIIQRDILGRYDVEYPGLLEELAVYLLNSSGNKISMNKMAARTGLKSLQTARVYARYMETTFLLFTVSKFSWRLKEQQAAMKKAYCSDNGMLSAMLFDISPDKGRFLENLVAIELKRRQARGSGDLFYWDDGSRECDFLIKEGRTITTAIQVCHILTDENRNRELSGLSTAMERFDAGSGLILTADQSEDLLCGHRQVRVVPVWRWMLESN